MSRIHLHFDHAMAAGELAEIFGLKIYAHKAEKDTLENPAKNVSVMIGKREAYHADVFAEDDEILKLAGMELKVLHTPGHTEGGCCYYLEKEKTLFSGDTLFCQSVGRTDFPGGSMSGLVRSIREKLLTLPDDVKVYPGHMDITSIGRERTGNPFGSHLPHTILFYFHVLSAPSCFSGCSFLFCISLSSCSPTTRKCLSKARIAISRSLSARAW